ncbi:MAG: TfuA-like protein, partial [Pyrinomonadaceae bacterium]
MSKISNCLIFAGPTLIGVDISASAKRRVKVLPPVKRGDIEKIVCMRKPAAMAIVDGLFHQCLSAGHAEIRLAVTSGWQVWGLSSMGAIRAYEMRDMGVRGYGRVYG